MTQQPRSADGRFGAVPRPEPQGVTLSAGCDDGRKIDSERPADVGRSIAARYPGSRLSLGGRPDQGYVQLNVIELPKGQRGQGTGTAMMNDLLEHADAHGWDLSLTPSADFGGSVPRLKKFYARFGFVENKGRNRDFTTRDTMIRPAR
ncbi:GNAT family N-acetyltransferase (plasmid) [Citricoccus nitrophenolicus]